MEVHGSIVAFSEETEITCAMKDKKGVFYEDSDTIEDVNVKSKVIILFLFRLKSHPHVQFVESMKPPTEEEIGWMNLDRCIRLLPHVQDTGFACSDLKCA